MKTRRKPQRNPKVPTYKTAQEKPPIVSAVTADGRARQAEMHKLKNNRDLNDFFEILKRQPEWALLKTKSVSILRSAGVPKESITEAIDTLITDFYKECERN